MDLNDLYIDWLIHCAKQERNFTPLIKHIRSGNEIPLRLALFIADLLEGKVKSSAKHEKRAYRISKLYLKLNIECYKQLIGNKSDLDGDTIMIILKDAGYEGLPESKGEITKAAWMLTCKRLGLTFAQLDERLNTRARRKKIT